MSGNVCDVRGEQMSFPVLRGVRQLWEYENLALVQRE